MQQMVTVRARLSHTFGGRVASDEKSRNREIERCAQRFDRFDAVSTIGQPIIGNDEIGRFHADRNIDVKSAGLQRSLRRLS